MTRFEFVIDELGFILVQSISSVTSWYTKDKGLVEKIKCTLNFYLGLLQHCQADFVYCLCSHHIDFLFQTKLKSNIIP